VDLDQDVIVLHLGLGKLNSLNVVRFPIPQEIEVRVGVHTAEVEFIDNDVRGIGVHLAARIMAAASGSEILVSATTRDLASGTELTFTEKGSFDLKGISGPRTLYALDDGCSLLDGPARVR
jgi:class 3 adenylate cyclase